MFLQDTLDTYVQRFGMSVMEAENVICVTPAHQGKRIGDLRFQSLRAYSKWRLYPEAKEDLVRQVRASKIVMTARRLEKVTKRVAKEREDDAKRCRAKCISCGNETWVPTKVFDRAGRPTCFHCGGTIAREAATCETFTTSQVSTMLNCKIAEVCAMIAAGRLVAWKRAGRWAVSAPSATKLMRERDARREHKAAKAELLG